MSGDLPRSTSSKSALSIIALLCIIAVTIIFPALGRALTNARAAAAQVPQEATTLDVAGPINAVAFNNVGDTLAILSNYGGRITLFSTADWALEKEANRFGGTYSFNSLVLLPNRHVVVSTPVGDYSGDPRWANTSLVDPRYHRMDNFALVEWDPFASKAIKYYPSVDAASAVKLGDIHNADTFTISPDGSFIVAVNLDHVLILNAKTGTLLRTFTTPDGDITSVAIFGETLAIGTMDGHVILYDLAHGGVMREFEAYPKSEYSVQSISFSPDGRFLATGRSKNTDGYLVAGQWIVRQHSLLEGDIWSIDGSHKSSLTVTSDIAGGDDAVKVYSLAWSPDGHLLAVGDERGFILWHVDKGATSLAWHQSLRGGAYSVAFSVNGTLAVGNNSHVTIYR